MSSDSRDWQLVQDLVGQMETLIRVRCGYKFCHVQEKGHDVVTIEGVSFESKVLRKNLEEVDGVFPFVVTLGDQPEERSKATEDILEQYYLNTIANVALQDALKSLCTYLQDEYKVQQLSYMSPGSLQDWPLSQQEQLFSLLGEVEKKVGVSLGANMLMYPSKSESGIFFPTKTPFFSCQLCPREGCPLRKAAFDEELAKDFGLL